MHICTTHFKIACKIIFLLCFVLTFCTSSFAQDTKTNEAAIIAYEKNRQTFLDKQRETDQMFNKEASALKREVGSLQEKISSRNDELNRLNSVIREKQGRINTLESVQNSIASFLFPLAGLGANTIGFFLGKWSVVINLLCVFLALTTLNLFLYLKFRQKQFFNKYRIGLIIALVVFISAITSPLFAEDDLTRRENVIDQLDFAEKVLSQTDHERFIAILEYKVSEQIDLPELASGDPLLSVFRRVRINTTEYYYTLAALYMHEGKTGKAVDAIEQIVEKSTLQANKSHNMIANNSIRFLIQQQKTELASRAVENLAENIGDVSVLLELAEFLQNNGMQVSEEKVLGYAIGRANTVDELVQLSTFLLNRGENDKGTDALQQALSKVRSVDQLILIAKAAIKAKKDGIIEEITEKTKQVSDYSGRLQIADLFLENGRKEEAIDVFAEMINQAKGRTNDKINKLLFAIDAALKRDFLNQAVKATKLLFIYLGEEKYSFQMEVGRELAIAKKLPNPDKITLPQFYGLLNEEMDYNDKAEEQYIHNIHSSLKKILQSFGYELPESLNDFHLLGRIWVEENRGDLIGNLDRVYSIVEEQFVKRQAMQNDLSLEGLREQLHRMKSEHQQLLSEIQGKNKQISGVNKDLSVRLVSVIATVTLLLTIFIGCIVIAYLYARDLVLHKTFGFIIKLFETTGWVRVLSVLGVVSGLGTIFVAQLFQILQGTEENTFRLTIAQETTNTTKVDSPKQTVQMPSGDANAKD